MKILGWVLTVLGGGGLIGTLVARDSDQYKLYGLAGNIDSFAGMLGLDTELDNGFKTTVDILFYVAIGVLILGFILLIVGYVKGGANRNQPPQLVQYPAAPPASSRRPVTQSVCPNCNIAVSDRDQLFCANCGQKVR